MRIVHVITQGDVGGAQTHVVELASAQRDAGHDVSVIAGSGGAALERAADSGLGVTVLPVLLPSRLRTPRWGGRHALVEALRRAGPDVVHGHSSHAGLLARLAARQLGVASIYTAHGWPFQRGARMNQRITSLLGEWIGGRLGDAVICLTVAEVERARRWHIVAGDRLWLVSNGLRDVEGALRRTVATESLRILMVARFAPPKRQINVVRALALLDRMAPGQRWSMTFVGDGPDLGPARQLAQQTVGSKVSFVGERNDVAQLLSHHDVHVLWSGYEGLPLAMLEAMRAGLCVIANDLPGARELSGELGAALVPGSVDDVAALADVLLQLITDRTLVDRHGALARQRYEEAFTLDLMLTRTQAVYDAVLERAR